MLTAQEVYTSTVRDLPVAERLRLAALILNDVTQTGDKNQEAVDVPDHSRITGEEYKAAVEMLFQRYDHALKRLAE